jgi:hypothetical protein
MALDMSEVVGDVDLGNNYPVIIIRRTRVTGADGKPTFSQSAMNIWAEVVPASGRQLQRLAEADRVTAGIAIYTTTEIVCNAPGFAPDIIMWKNQPYLVGYVDDYSGNGYYGAVATLTQLTGPVPNTIAD